MTDDDRIAAAAEKYGASEEDVRATVEQLRTQFDVTQAEAIDAIENLCLQPKFGT